MAGRRFLKAISALLLFSAACGTMKVRWNDTLLARDATAGTPTIIVPAAVGFRDPRHIYDVLASKLEAVGLHVERAGMDGEGSAFVLSSSGLVVTAAHVVGPYEQVSVTIKEQKIPSRIVLVDEKRDIALLQLSTVPPGLQSLVLAPQGSRSLGQEVFAVGFPLSDLLGGSHNVTKGVVSADVGLKGDPTGFQFSAQVQPGSSGGPLLNASGQVVGFVTGTLATGDGAATSAQTQNVNFAVKTETLAALLAERGIVIPSTPSGPVVTAMAAPEALPSAAPAPTVSPAGSLQQSMAGVVKVTAGDAKANRFLATLAYTSAWDFYHGFFLFAFQLNDTKSGDLLMSQTHRHTPGGFLKSESVALDEVVQAMLAQPLFSRSVDDLGARQRAAQRADDRRILRIREPEIRGCFARFGSKLTAKEQATIQLGFFITASGFVRYPSVAVVREGIQTEGQLEALSDCIEPHVRATRFAMVGGVHRFLFDEIAVGSDGAAVTPIAHRPRG